jgi:hypothetical protein
MFIHDGKTYAPYIDQLICHLSLNLMKVSITATRTRRPGVSAVARGCKHKGPSCQEVAMQTNMRVAGSRQRSKPLLHNPGTNALLVASYCCPTRLS